MFSKPFYLRGIWTLILVIKQNNIFSIIGISILLTVCFHLKQMHVIYSKKNIRYTLSPPSRCFSSLPIRFIKWNSISYLLKFHHFGCAYVHNFHWTQAYWCCTFMLLPPLIYNKVLKFTNYKHVSTRNSLHLYTKKIEFWSYPLSHSGGIQREKWRPRSKMDYSWRNAKARIITMRKMSFK